jgi:hypothetical protein
MQLGTVQNSKDLLSKIQAVNEQILKIVVRGDKINDEQDLEKLEKEVQALTRELGDLIVVQKVQQTIDEDAAFRASAADLARRARKSLVDKGRVLQCSTYMRLLS